MRDDLRMKSRVHPDYKTQYRVKNWATYDRSLVERGDITLWISLDAIESWKPARARGAGCVNRARPDLWGPRVGNCPGLPGSAPRFRIAQEPGPLRVRIRFEDSRMALRDSSN